jgi:hypothetical protein
MLKRVETDFLERNALQAPERYSGRFSKRFRPVAGMEYARVAIEFVVMAE